MSFHIVLKGCEVREMRKIYMTFDEAIEDVGDQATILVGGFGLCGIPEGLIKALKVKGSKHLSIISNNCGIDNYGLGLLLTNKQISKMTASYIGENKTFESQFLNNEIEVELVPQGTLVEKIRAGGAGIPAFYTRTGVGTPVAKGKEHKLFKGKECILEESLVGDFSFVKAWKADSYGNLCYRKTARNFNPQIATAGKITIAEVEEIVDELQPDEIHTPGIYVQRVVRSLNSEKKIEKLTLSKKGEEYVRS